MALLTIPTWPFEANWSDDLNEVLEWMTDVMRSPTGAEQRRALRLYPRRTVEFQILAEGSERSLLDNLLVAHGARDWYLPLWHDAHFASADIAADAHAIPCSTALTGEFRVGDVVFIGGTSPFEYELAEIAAIDSDAITLVDGLAKAWPIDSRVHPVRRARLTEQPLVRRESSNVATSRVRFRLVEMNNDIGETLPAAGEPLIDFLPVSYRGFSVLTMAPDESEALEYGYQRITEEIDNQVGIPVRHDSASKSFPTQKYRWILNGREQHSEFRALIYPLRGKAIPLWVPTFFDDFELVAPIVEDDLSLTVREVGFTAAGGASDSRRDIMIELVDGTRLFRRIVASSLASPGTEILGLDAAFPASIAPDEVLRISFIALCRLDQDNVEIAHRTDTSGVSLVSAAFRATPDVRQALTGF